MPYYPPPVYGGSNDILAAFRATVSSQSYTGNTTVTVAYATEVFDNGEYYNNATYRWTPPAGIVHLSANISVDVLNTGVFELRKNGTSVFVEVRRDGSNQSAAHEIVLTDSANGTDYYDVIFTNFSNNGSITLGSFSGIAFRTP